MKWNEINSIDIATLQCYVVFNFMLIAFLTRATARQYNVSDLPGESQDGFIINASQVRVALSPGCIADVGMYYALEILHKSWRKVFDLVKKLAYY